MSTPTGVSWTYLTVLVVTKIVGSAGLRMYFPFAPFLAADWGLSSNEIATILSISEIGGALAGFLAPVADVTSLGQKNTALISLVLMVITTLAVVAPPNPIAITVLRFTYLVTLNLVYVMMQSITVGLVPVDKIGRVTGVLESSWSLSLFVAIPILSVAYSNLGWRAPFVIQGSLLALLLFAFHWVVPKDTRDVSNLASSKRCRSLFVGMGKAYLVSLSNLASVLLVLAAFFLTLAHHSIFTAYAYYAEEVYELSTEELGTTQTVIGAAELCGVLLVALISDRVGMGRSVIVSSIAFAVSIACLIGTSSTGNLALVLANIFFIYMPGEAGIVVNIAIAESYVEDSLKATFLGINFQIMAIARSIATVLAEYLYRTYDFTTVCIFSAVCAALCSCLYFVSIRLRVSKTRETGSKVSEASTDNETSSTPDPEVGELQDHTKESSIAASEEDVKLDQVDTTTTPTTLAQT